MSPVRPEAFDGPPARCEFEMDENTMGFPVGARCCREANHGELEHIIAMPARDSATYWSVEPGERLAKAVMHVDMRNGQSINDEEAHTLWAYMELRSQR